MMTALLIGLLVIFGAVLGIFALLIICGVGYIFFSNNSPWSSSYTPYIWSNIFHASITGIGILFFIVAVLAVAYMIGINIIS